MRLELSEAQKEAREQFRTFARERIAPHAAEWDRDHRMPASTVAELRAQGYLGAPFPKKVGGGGMDLITYGLLTEELGRACSSTRTLLTVHDMVCNALWRWGNKYLKSEFLPKVARGELLGAFALTEPNVGSDARSIETEARADGDDYILNGRKKWISYGELADVFLVFAHCEGKHAAFLVPADAPGFSHRPILGVMGTRAAMISELDLEDCRVPAKQLVGRLGFGFSHVALAALEQGRYSVAWGSVGIAQACLDACLDYSAKRTQFGAPIADHQLVRAMLTRMIAETRAARLLCYRAGYLREHVHPGAAMETMLAKYYAARTATRIANDAVQLHGANGLSDEYPVARYLRDSKVMEIIEGSTQVQEITIPRYPMDEL